MRLAIYIDFLSLPSRRPRCERFRVNVTKTSIPGTHQESISIDEGQLTFFLYPSSVELRRRISFSMATLSPSRSKSRLAGKLTILSQRGVSFFKEIPSERSASVSYRIHHGRTLLIATSNSLSVDAVTDNGNVLCMFNDNSRSFNEYCKFETQ